MSDKSEFIKALSEQANATREQWCEMAFCPFCSARASDYLISISYSYSEDSDGKLSGNFFGECSECGTSGPSMDTPELALAKWNGRSA